MSAIKIIQAFAKKSLTKDKGSGITSLPSQMAAESEAGSIVAVLQRAGIPIEQLDNFIKSEKDLIKYLNIIEATSKPNYTVFSGQEAMDQLNKLFPKKGEVVKFPQKRSFAEEIEAMKKSGDIVDEDKMVISEKITDREMFKDAGKRFNKPKTEAEIKTKLEKENKENVAKINKRIMEEDREIENLYGSAGFGNDQKIDAEFLAEYLAENAGKVYDDLLPKERINFYGRAYDALTRYKKNVGRSVIDEPQKGPNTPEFDGVNKDPEYAKGGRAGHYTGGMVDVEPSLSDIGHGSDALMARTRLISPGAQGTTSTGLNYLLAEDNDNIRVPFGNGKNFEMYLRERGEIERKENSERLYKEYLEDMRRKKVMQQKQEAAEGGRIGFSAGGGGRRAFLKLLATLGGGVAAAKTGILGLGGKETGKQAVKEVVKKAGGANEVPPYFFKLVDKIKTLGDETMATQDKAIAKKYKDYVMEEDFAGNITIIKKNMDDPYPEEVIMSYKVDDVNLPSGKGMAKVDEYEEFTVRPDKDGKMKDIEGGVPDEVVQEGTMFEDTMTEFGKAEGGRINFNVGGLANVLARLGIKGSSRRFLEKAFGKENFENMIKNDPEMHRGLLEVVEMFRNRDKEGLKMYMQKFLPHMDDATVEEFIVGTTPDIEGLTGQLTRLGSGRDYAGKLEMMKKADQVKKLQNFDIKNVTKNAEGGRIELKGGGDALKALLNYFAKEAGKKGSQQLKDINPKALDSGILNIMGPEHLKMLQKNQTDYLENLLNVIKSDKKFLDQNKKLAETMMKDAPEGFEDQAQNIVKMMVESTMGKGGRLDRLKVYDKINIDDAIVDVEQMIKNRRVKESDGRVLNASGGLQAMLGE